MILWELCQATERIRKGPNLGWSELANGRRETLKCIHIILYIIKSSVISYILQSTRLQVAGNSPSPRPALRILTICRTIVDYDCHVTSFPPFLGLLFWLPRLLIPTRCQPLCHNITSHFSHLWITSLRAVNFAKQEPRNLSTFFAPQFMRHQLMKRLGRFEQWNHHAIFHTNKPSFRRAQHWDLWQALFLLFYEHGKWPDVDGISETVDPSSAMCVLR